MSVNNKYEKIEKIGEGAYGIVYKAIDLNTKNFVAIKVIRLEHCQDGIPATTIREIAHLKQLNHNNIVNLWDINFEGNQIFLIFEYIDNDLKKFLNEKKFISEENIIKILYQLAESINFLHISKIFHRDLKPSNILIDNNYNIKIADFGLSKTFAEFNEEKEYTPEVITLWYRSPEILLGNTSYDSSIDIFSIGCIICELILNKPIFQGDSEIDQLYKIFEIMGTPTVENWSEIQNYPHFKTSFPKWKENKLKAHLWKFRDINNNLLDLINEMLILDPKKRISAEEILENPIFNDINNNLNYN